MRRKIGAGPRVFLIDFAEDRNDAVRHQIHQIGTRRSADAIFRMLKERSERRTARRGLVEHAGDRIHFQHQLLRAVRFAQLVESIFQLRGKGEGAHQRGNAILHWS